MRVSKGRAIVIDLGASLIIIFICNPDVDNIGDAILEATEAF